VILPLFWYGEHFPFSFWQPPHSLFSLLTRDYGCPPPRRRGCGHLPPPHPPLSFFFSGIVNPLPPPPPPPTQKRTNPPSPRGFLPPPGNFSFLCWERFYPFPSFFLLKILLATIKIRPHPLFFLFLESLRFLSFRNAGTPAFRKSKFFFPLSVPARVS